MKKSDEFELENKYTLPKAGHRDIPKKEGREHYTYYGKGGNEVDETEAFARVIAYENAEHHFIWFWKGELYDPYGHEILRRNQNMMAKYVRVNRKIFENYIRYLKTRNKIFYTTARRDKMRG
jgi:hypothetical protein